MSQIHILYIYTLLADHFLSVMHLNTTIIICKAFYLIELETSIREGSIYKVYIYIDMTPT